MFAIFVLTLLSLALFPYTMYRFCNGSDEEEGVVKPWQVLTAYCVLLWLLAASNVALPAAVVSTPAALIKHSVATTLRTHLASWSFYVVHLLWRDSRSRGSCKPNSRLSYGSILLFVPCRQRERGRTQ